MRIILCLLFALMLVLSVSCDASRDDTTIGSRGNEAAIEPVNEITSDKEQDIAIAEEAGKPDEKPGFELVKKSREPVDILDDIPLYIEYDFDSGEIIISYAGSLCDLRMVEVHFDIDMNFWYENLIYSRYDASSTGIHYQAYIPNNDPWEDYEYFRENFERSSDDDWYWSMSYDYWPAVNITDWDGNVHSYLLNETDGSLNVTKIEARKRMHSDDSIISVLGNAKSVSVKLSLPRLVLVLPPWEFYKIATTL